MKDVGRRMIPTMVPIRRSQYHFRHSALACASESFMPTEEWCSGSLCGKSRSQRFVHDGSIS